MQTESEKKLIDEIKSILAEIVKEGVFTSTKEILIMTPKEGVPIIKGVN